MTAVIAPAAEARLLVSINDSATIEAAITPMAIAIIRIAPFTFCAPLRLLIIIVIIALSKPTATIPLAKLATSMKLSKIHTPAKIAIAADIANIVPATLAIFCSLPIVRMLTSTLSSTTKAATNIPPLTISSVDNMPTSLQTPTSSMSETDTLSASPLTLASFCSLPILVTATKAPINTTNAAANIPPLIISSVDKVLTNLQTPTNRAMTTASFIAILPTLLIFSLAPFEAAVNNAINIANAPANKIPLPISSADSIPTSLHAITISIIATASFFIILPILLTSPE